MNRVCSLDSINQLFITVKKGDKRFPIQNIPPQTSRTLVGVLVNPTQTLKAAVPVFQEKIIQHIARLATCPLLPSQILAGYDFFW